MITVQTNTMLVSAFPKELNLIIYDYILTSSAFSSVTEINEALKSLVRLDKSRNLFFNDSENTLCLIKKLSQRFDIFDFDVVEQLSLKGAQLRRLLQWAALDWDKGSAVFCKDLHSLCSGGLDVNFTYGPHKLPYPTMLMRAAYWNACGWSDIGQCLIKKGADINMITKAGKSAPMLALFYCNEQMIPLFLNHPQLNVQHKDNNGNTLLHCCFQKGLNYDGYAGVISLKKCEAMCPIIKTLLEKGVDRHAINSAGETAFDLAKETEYKPFLAILNS